MLTRLLTSPDYSPQADFAGLIPSQDRLLPGCRPEAKNSEQRHHWESYQFEVRPVHSRFIARTLSESILCNQHYAEPRFALHHASVSISGLFERRCLDHWADIR